MARIISLCNHKGGVGKTTSAVSIAAGLSKRSRRVLLVDLDPQANTTQAAGVNPYTVERTIYGAMVGRYPLPIIHTSGGWDVVPSCLDLVAAETQLLNEYSREHILANLVDPVAADYDFIIIDCPPSLGVLTINALTASDALLVPVQPHFFAVQGLQQLLDIVAKVRRGLNTRLTIGGVFLTDYDWRVKMHTDAADAIRQAFPDEMFATRIRHNVALSECAARGMSIFDYAPTSNGARDYGALVDELLAR